MRESFGGMYYITQAGENALAEAEDREPDFINEQPYAILKRSVLDGSDVPAQGE